jgi:hypothetical protein
MATLAAQPPFVDGLAHTLREGSMSTAPVAELPKSKAERVLAAVPVVLTILATILAGLSSSEMTQSMYFRSLAAQNQSKAGSQWGFFQAKRIRGTTMENGGDLVRTLADPPVLSRESLRSAAGDRSGKAQGRILDILNGKSIDSSLRYLTTQDLPPVSDQRTGDDQIRELVKAIEGRQTETQTAKRVLEVPIERIEQAIEVAEANAAAFDEACKPVTADLRTLERAFADQGAELRQQKPGPDDAAVKSVKETLAGLRAARQDFTARRYAKEATYNQESAELIEVLARRNGAESDRHRHRSKNFFYAMLCAQAGVTIASLALAQSRKSWFWAAAGAAGFIAVSFGAYVYLAL